VREPYDDATISDYMRDKRYKDRDARREHLQKGKYATNVWRVPSLKGASNEKCGHPSQKPRALIERIVQSSSAPGDLILDPFLGSGTTAIVARDLDRRCIGIEIEKDYVALAKKRLKTSGVESAAGQAL
jgi:site-specific DNA-methyltransferase (adenine-specific)